MNNEKDPAKSSKTNSEKNVAEKISGYAKASYFQEKDKKATAFLKKHPVPSKFFQ